MAKLTHISNRPPRSRAPFKLQDVQDTFDYCAETGTLYYKGTDTAVSSHLCDGAVYLRVANKEVSVHRLLWYIHYGEWPAFNLRHLNGDRTDNRLANLARARWANDRGRPDHYKPARGPAVLDPEGPDW